MPKKSQPSSNDQRSNVKNPNNQDHKTNRDNRSNQKNPNHSSTKGGSQGGTR